MLQMEIPLEQNWAAVRLAKAKGARIILSVAPAGPVPETILTSVDILMVNEIEGKTVAEAVGLAAGDAERTLSALAERYPSRWRRSACPRARSASASACAGS